MATCSVPGHRPINTRASHGLRPKPPQQTTLAASFSKLTSGATNNALRSDPRVNTFEKRTMAFLGRTLKPKCRSLSSLQRNYKTELEPGG